MASHAFNYSDRLITTSCCNCGITFGIPEDHNRVLVDTKRVFYCPNGHGQSYTGATEAEKLKKELEREKQRREMAEREAAMEAKRAKKSEAELGRVKTRVHNGVCPCCNRTFQNLARHMATKHPEHKET
jgi:hypothetical protein